MRILNFTNSYKPTIGGIEISIEMFRQGLIDAGHEVAIICPEHKNYVDEAPYVFRAPSIDVPEKIADVAIGFPLQSLLNITVQGLKPDLIHSQHPFLFGDVAASFAEELGVPLVHTFHTRYDTYFQKYVPILPELAGKLANEMVISYLKKCNYLIAPTPGIRDFIIDEYKVDIPITPIPTPIDLSAYENLDGGPVRARLGLEEAEVLLCITRLFPEKNMDFLLRAFAIVAANRPAARLLIVGDGPAMNALQQQTKKLKLENKIIFTGSVPHPHIPTYAAAADLFFFASQSETQGIVLVEALAAGKPVVALKASGVVDVLAEGGGIMTPPSEDALAEAAISLLTDDEQRQSLSQKAQQAAQRYSIAGATGRLIEAYEQALVRH